ncbi:hypothetical protein ACP70R_035244 [Stipagrostis hirtigluma subsp. patula]
MDALEKRLMDRLDKLEANSVSAEEFKTKFEAIESAMTDQGDRVDRMQTRLDLAMVSLGKVQQEQIATARTLKHAAPGAAGMASGDGIIGSRPSTLAPESQIPPEFQL